MSDPFTPPDDQSFDFVSTDVDRSATNLHVFTNICIVCGGRNIITVEADKYNLWRNKEYIQNVWPELAPGLREMMINGTHSACFEKLFPPEQE